MYVVCCVAFLTNLTQLGKTTVQNESRCVSLGAENCTENAMEVDVDCSSTPGAHSHRLSRDFPSNLVRYFLRYYLFHVFSCRGRLKHSEILRSGARCVFHHLVLRSAGHHSLKYDVSVRWLS